jgi:hypothetical protein
MTSSKRMSVYDLFDANIVNVSASFGRCPGRIVGESVNAAAFFGFFSSFSQQQ